MSLLVVAGQGTRESAMEKPDTPFPRHWLYYIAIKLVVLAGALALVLKLLRRW